MTREQVAECLKSEEGLEKLLAEYTDVFQEIDDKAEQLRKGMFEQGDQFKFAITELTGLYMNLKPVCEALESEKRNRELSAFNQLKRAAEEEGNKFVATSGEKQAAEQVATYRNVRNVFTGYADACQVAISSCQSVLRYLVEEIHLSKGKQV